MNPFELMEIKKSSFTKKEMVIYEYFKNNSDQVLRASINELADTFKVSQPTLSRFCQKLGFSGFNDFKYNVYRYQKGDINTAKDASGTNCEHAVLNSYKTLIDSLDTMVDIQQLKALAKNIISARRIYVTGMHKSYLSAQLLRYNLIKFGINCTCFNNDDRQEIIHLANAEDLIILISSQMVSAQPFIKTMQDLQIPMAAITMVDKAPHKNNFKHYIWLPNYRNQNMKTYTENMVIFAIFIDLLTSYVAQADLDK